MHMIIIHVIKQMWLKMPYYLILASSIVDQILMHWYAEHLLRLRRYLHEGVKGINEGTMLNSLAHHHPSTYCKS